MAKRIAGTCYVRVDGTQLDLEASVEFPLNKTTRESLLGVNGHVGFSEKATQQYVKGTFWVPKGFPLQKVMDGQDMTVTVECANGWVYTLTGAYVAGDVSFNPNDGKTEMTFEGENGEVLNG